MEAGSSPLARGLRLVGTVRALGVRIIPARAGFTLSDEWVNDDDEDHPRSRGVYRRLGQRISPMSGSSPLARGLLPVPEPAPGGGGIIPARAGFTLLAVELIGGRADHPRSRGVYHSQSVGTAHGLGSSPLARGLLAATRHGYE